jgi:hypothetical protein
MESNKIQKQFLKLAANFALLLMIILLLSKFNCSQSTVDKDFMRQLDKTGYGFKGKVINVESIGREGGIICMEQIQMNSNSPQELLFRNQVVSKISSSGTILHIGVILFTNKEGDTLYNLDFGDVVQYNFNGDGYYKVFRHDELILETSPIIYNPTIKKKFDNYMCPQLSFTNTNLFFPDSYQE